MNNTQGNSKKKLFIALGAGGGALVIALVVVVVLLLNRPPQTTPVVPAPNGARATVVTPENVDELRAQADSHVSAGSYRVTMNTDWVFPTATEPSTNAMVENHVNNTRTVYFDLVLDDTEELVYSSPYIPVGGKLENFALDVPVPAGEYTAAVVYHLVDDNEQEVGKVSFGVTVRILE